MAATGAHASPKDDVVVLRNGDRLTGELKGLQRGSLSFKTEPTDKISIEWDDVAQLTSRRHVKVETTAGARYFGILKSGTKAASVLVEGFDTSVELPMTDIVRLTPIEDRFWARVDGSLSLGYSDTQSSGVRTFNFSSSSTYRTRNFQYGLDLDSDVTRQESGTSSRQDATIRFLRFLPRRWFTAWNPQVQKNEDLGLDLRLLLPVGVGRTLVQSNRMQLDVAGGLAGNREYPAGEEDARSTLEGLLVTDLELFRDDFPRADASIGLSVYPGITERGSLRGEFDASMRYEIVKDLFIQLDLKDSYDNRPETPGADHNDLVLTTSVSWTY